MYLNGDEYYHVRVIKTSGELRIQKLSTLFRKLPEIPKTVQSEKYQFSKKSIYCR